MSAWIPKPGSNAIGLFTVGVSQIGTIPPFDWYATVISQFASSSTLVSLLDYSFQWWDQTENFDDFYDDIWLIDIAQGYGLDVWGRILGFSRVLAIPDGELFGFEEAAGAGTKGFNQAPFYSGIHSTSNVSLNDDDYRRALLAKAFANICDGSILAINTILSQLFPNRGNAYVTDNGDMTLDYVFTFVLSPVERAIVQSGILPKPVGVKASIVIS